MAGILDSLGYSQHESIHFNLHTRKGFELDFTSKGGKKMNFGDYLVAPNSLYRVEDAQVPEFSEPPSLMDLSTPSSALVLDTPAIIDSIVDVLPFHFNNPTVIDMTSLDSEMSPALGLEETERFQDLTHLMVRSPIPTISCSPAPPLTSPTDSFCSDITQSSCTSLLSAASTSSDPHFFALDFEVIGSGSAKSGSEFGNGEATSYVDKRKRNNLASRRSRQTRREREKDMEKQLSSLFDENVSLKDKVRKLEELVEQTKKIIMQAVARR